MSEPHESKRDAFLIPPDEERTPIPPPPTEDDEDISVPEPEPRPAEPSASVPLEDEPRTRHRPAPVERPDIPEPRRREREHTERERGTPAPERESRHERGDDLERRVQEHGQRRGVPVNPDDVTFTSLTDEEKKFTREEKIIGRLTTGMIAGIAGGMTLLSFMGGLLPVSFPVIILAGSSLIALAGVTYATFSMLVYLNKVSEKKKKLKRLQEEGRQ